MDLATKEFYQQHIDQYLLDNLTEQPHSVSGLANGRVEQFHNHLCAEYPNRKHDHFQSLLLVYSGLAMGATFDQLIHVGAALKLAQIYTDIRKDTFMENPWRNGRPSLPIKYGCPLAINAGDSLLLTIWRLLFDKESKIGKEKTLDLVDEFSCMLFKNSVAKLSSLAPEKRESLKNTHYEVDYSISWPYFAAPLRLAAIVAREKTDRITRVFPVFNEMCTYLGRAFQLAVESKCVIRAINGSSSEPCIGILDRSIFFGAMLDRITEKQKQEMQKTLAKAPSKRQEPELRKLYQTIKSTGGFEIALRTFESWTNRAFCEFESCEFFTDQKATQELHKILKEILLSECLFKIRGDEYKTSGSIKCFGFCLIK